MAGEDFGQAENRRVLRWEQAGVSSTQDPSSSSWVKFPSESLSGGDCYFPLLRAGIRPCYGLFRFDVLAALFCTQVPWNVGSKLA
jgi:hypothetical protein